MSTPLENDRKEAAVTKTELEAKLLALPVADRLDLAQALWDSASPPPDPPLSDELKALLDRRRAEFFADPDAGSSWEEVKARILAKS